MQAQHCQSMQAGEHIIQMWSVKLSTVLQVESLQILQGTHAPRQALQRTSARAMPPQLSWPQA